MLRTTSRLLLWACLVLVVPACNLADKVVLWPPSGPAPENGLSRRVAKVDGREIEIWTAPAQDGETDAYVLSFYGNGERADWSVPRDALRHRRLAFWGVNYPGYGGSTGPATLRGVATAALAAYDALAREAQGKPILVFGNSLGTTAALHVGAHRHVHGIVLRNPPPLKRLVLGEYGWWNLWIAAAITASGVPDELDSEENARRCKAEAVFIMSERDEVVPPEYQKRILAAYAGPKEVVVIPGGVHNTDPSPATSAKMIEAVERLTRSARDPTTPGGSPRATGDRAPRRRFRRRARLGSRMRP
jgi:uncharacterized protein